MKINKTIVCIFLIIASQFIAVMVPPLRQATWFLNIAALIFLPYQRILRFPHYFPKNFLPVFLLLLVFDASLIIRGIIYPNNQTLQSIVGNPAFSTYHTLPIFILLATSDKIATVLFKSFKYVIVLSLLVGIIFKSISLSNGCVYFLVVFYPYIPTKKARLIYSILIVLTGLMVSLMLGMRMVFMGVLMFGWLLFIYNYSASLNSVRKKIKITVFALIFTPFTLFMVAVTTGYSIFDISKEFQFLADSETGSNDTRTFVWKETLTDLTTNNAIVWGKGMSGTIKTQLQSFVDATVKNKRRLFVEASFLETFRRGGIILVLLHLIVLVWAVRYACKNSQNTLLLLAAATLSFFFFLSFIGHVAMFSHEYVLFWILTGMCLSKKWNMRTDEEIFQMIKFPQKQLQ